MSVRLAVRQRLVAYCNAIKQICFSSCSECAQITVSVTEWTVKVFLIRMEYA